MVMRAIIECVDKNVDGCGTDIKTYFEIEGDRFLKYKTLEEIDKAILEYKEKNEDYQTDDIINVICNTLTNEGYKCIDTLQYTIEF